MDTQDDQQMGGDLERAPGRALRARPNEATIVDIAAPTGGAVAPDEDSLFSLEPIKRWANFVLRAIRRHRVVALLSLVIATALGGMLLAASPAQYQTSATVLLGGDNILGGTTGVSTSASRQAQSIILRRDNLDIIIDEASLLDEVEKPFFGRLKDSIFPSQQTTAERTETLRTTLRTALLVFANNNADTVEISVIWSDPQQAAAIVQSAYDRFLEERIRLEVGPLREQVAILEGRATQASLLVEQLRDDLDLGPGDGAQAGSELESANNAEQDLLGQVRNAQLALAQSEAGIEFRYALSAAPEVPTQPISGNLTGYIAALMFGLVVMGLACVALDAPRGRIIATWQLEQERIPVLAVLRPAPSGR